MGTRRYGGVGVTQPLAGRVGLEGLAADESLHLPSLDQDVLMERVSIASAASQLQSLESRQLAYEVAVCVCDADGNQSDAERRFLEEVRTTLAIAPPAAADLGGLLGKLGGGMARGLGNQAVSSGMSFASTYALGHVAKRYYAGGRQLSAAMLKEAVANLTQEARSLQSQYLPAIRDKASTLDAGKVLAMVRGA
ncbi:hypothetical protein BH11PSE9_BH11PSE9_00330 [soil metagenome]